MGRAHPALRPARRCRCRRRSAGASLACLAPSPSCVAGGSSHTRDSLDCAPTSSWSLMLPRLPTRSRAVLAASCRPALPPRHLQQAVPFSAGRKILDKEQAYNQIAAAPNDAETSSPDKLPLIKFHGVHSRHTLRGILRECTYFPDRFAADWFRNHALSRFREYKGLSSKDDRDAKLQERLQTLRRKSRQALYQLQKANEGDRKMMLKALSMAYGRVGRRRRELIASFLSVGGQSNRLEAVSDTANDRPEKGGSQQSVLLEDGQNGQDSSAAPQGVTKGSGSQSVKSQVKDFVRNLPPLLLELAESQIAASPPAISRKTPRRLGIDIPELNSWHKPMPKARVDNKLKKWYAYLLSTMQPPLPGREWRRLRDLALGVTTPELPIKRRTNLTPPPSALELVVMRGKAPESVFRKDHAHKVTPRYMSRIYAEVFSECPLMVYDSASLKWNITWGHRVLNEHQNVDKGHADAASTPNSTIPT